MTNTQRNTNCHPSGSTTISMPSEIFYDPDISVGHLRIHVAITQTATPSSNGWCSDVSLRSIVKKLGTDLRHSRRLAKKLVEKGYLEHIKISEGKWIWNICQITSEEIL